MPIVGVEMPDLEDGQEWSDLLRVQLTREQWLATLTFLTQDGTELVAALEDAKNEAHRNPKAAIAGLLLLGTYELLTASITAITEITLPQVAAQARADAAAIAWKDKMADASNMFRDLTPTEEADFREWARQNYKAGDRIDPVWHPVVRDECQRINVEVRGEALDA